MGESEADDDDPVANVDFEAGPVLLFDGVCNLCSGVVQFLIPRDPEGIVRFASLQSDVGQALLDRCGLPTDEFDSFVLVDDTDSYTKSAAAIQTAQYLRPPWSMLAALRVVPRPLRDLVYDLVAASRYRVFGRREQCLMPTPELRDRFIDGGIGPMDGQTT